MEKQKFDVVVTDDHVLFRKGVISLLSEFNIVNKTYEAGNGIELLELLEKTHPKPDVILLDLRMPVMDGIEAHKSIKSIYPEIKVIILTMEDDEQMILYMINEGANGYLQKNAEPDELERALSKVMKLDYYFSEEISVLILKNLKSLSKTVISRRDDFSSRELRVLQYICREFTTTQIAGEMDLSIRTIEGYRKNLFEKTGCRNVAGLIIFALKNKLVIM